MRWTAGLLVVLFAVTSACAGDDDGAAGDTSASTSTTVPSTTSTEGGGVHFDPGIEPEPEEGVDPDPCSADAAEDAQTVDLGNRIDCALPDLAPLVGSTTMLGANGHLDVFVTGELDVGQALQVCEVAVGVIATELTSWTDVRLTITNDPTIVLGQAPTPLVTATGVGTCAPGLTVTKPAPRGGLLPSRHAPNHRPRPAPRGPAGPRRRLQRRRR